MRPIVYLAHPLRGDWQANIADARRYVEYAARHGLVPVAPYITLDGLLVEPSDRELGLQIDMSAISGCEALILCGNTISAGMTIEKEHALSEGVHVFWARSPAEIPDGIYLRQRIKDEPGLLHDVLPW